MITKVVINNNGDTPIEYLSGLGAFKNGKTYEFKPGVNIIVVVHNPLLICSLSKNPEVNFIEMTRGYVKNIRKMVKELV